MYIFIMILLSTSTAYITAMETDHTTNISKGAEKWVHIRNQGSCEINLQRTAVYSLIAQKIKPKHEIYIEFKGEPITLTLGEKKFVIQHAGNYIFGKNEVESYYAVEKLIGYGTHKTQR